MKVLIFLVGFAFGAVSISVAIASVSQPRSEYEIDLINQDSVRVYSVDNDKLYYVHPDSIQYCIEIDNL